MKIQSKWKIDVSILEEGDIYFFYKPKRTVDHPQGFKDVARFFFVIQESGGQPARYVVMGNKKMPELEDGERTSWGFIQMVGGRGFETTSKMQTPSVKGTSRPAGEGIYAIVSHRTHSHLMYTLELPRQVGDVQKSFNIKREANYIMMQRPAHIGPRYMDLPFSNFLPVRDSDHLNQNGTQLLLIGVGPDIGRIGISADREKESIDTSDLINRLKLDVKRHPIAPLISGQWS
jgi:hypothetical protein